MGNNKSKNIIKPSVNYQDIIFYMFKKFNSEYQEKNIDKIL